CVDVQTVRFSCDFCAHVCSTDLTKHAWLDGLARNGLQLHRPQPWRLDSGGVRGACQEQPHSVPMSSAP
ncbi:MAG TPA: hypothetical protein VFM05_09005, partial [Candidatus Saccharimonadales bacterium]|nr:hypothetical protein [Candidatus Saccharimonadales bacterium]